jgi:hypothetical protein
MSRRRFALESLEGRLLLAADLQPAIFSGWSDAIVISNTTGTTTDSAQFPTGSTVRVDWGIGNFGSTATSGTFNNQLKLDGVVVTTVTRSTALNPGFGFGVLDTTLPSLAVGEHTLQVVIDSGGAIAESSETNNTLSRRFYYGNAANGEIRGTKWNDVNANGVRDAGEPGLSGWTVYCDVNNSGTLDAGDVSDVTDGSGAYELPNLPTGLYSVREIPQGTGTQTSPGPAGKSNNNFKITVDFLGGLTASQQAAFSAAAARWAQVIKNDLPDLFNVGFFVDDVRISAQGAAIDGVGGILGSAGPRLLRPTTLFPATGDMQFDSADLANMEANGTLTPVILHEMGHVLGIGTLWADKGLITGAGGSNPRFIGANATAQFNAIFNPDQPSVPVENTGGSGTRDGHWRESVMGNELMTGFVNGATTLPLSTITVGSLADLGYTVDYAAADPYVAPGPSARVAGRRSSSSGSALIQTDAGKHRPLLPTDPGKHRVLMPAETGDAPLGASAASAALISGNAWEVHVDPGEIVQNIDFGTHLVPTVTNVFVRGTTWNTAYRNLIQSAGDGEAAFGYRLKPAESAKTVAWSNVNQISLRFDGAATIASADLTVNGINVASYGVSAFAYDPATLTATWTLSRTIPNDKVTFNLNAAGGVSYASSLRVLPGDINRDGIVNTIDYNVLRPNLNLSGKGVAGGDINGDNLVSLVDYNEYRAYLNKTAPL